ncbi:MAG: DUF2155 domain-containing protein [Pseudomonadota bacterium]
MLRYALPLTALLVLAACDSEPAESETVEVPIGDASASTDGAEAAAEQAPSDSATDDGATPMPERVATIGLLNKRNNVSEDLEMRPGETREVGPVIVRLSACERTAPWEMPQETGAFVQVDVLERGESSHERVFSGWLFKESPSLNVVEHPVYDVWVKDCAMSFPGEA